MIFSAWFGYYEYVGYLLRGMMLIILSVSIWSLSASSGLPGRGASSSGKSPAWNFTNHFWHVQSDTAPSPCHCTNLFLRFSCIFTFLEIIKRIIWRKCCFFSSTFSVKMATQKFTNFGTSLVAQQLRLRDPIAGGLGSIPGQGTRSYMHEATKSSHSATKEPTGCNWGAHVLQLRSPPAATRTLRNQKKKSMMLINIYKKISNFDQFFFKCTLIWQLYIKSNKIVLNEVKVN